MRIISDEIVEYRIIQFDTLTTDSKKGLDMLNLFVKNTKEDEWYIEPESLSYELIDDSYKAEIKFLRNV